MSRAELCKKRPCRVCRRWFMPNPRLKDRQKTCGAPCCQREWHRKKCAQWNKDNSDYFKANYLQSKVEAQGSRGSPQPASRLKSGLPLQYVQEVIGIQHLTIIEYFGQLLFRRFQEVLKVQLYVNTEKIRRLPHRSALRCDRL